MGCTASTNAIPPADIKKPLQMMLATDIDAEFPTPVAFVVPLNEQDDDGLIKKHPPKRFQRLEEQGTSPPVITLKMLQDKLTEADQRRLKILHDRIESAKISMKPKYTNAAINKVENMANSPRPIEVEG